MGQEIFYCSKCSARLMGSEMAKGNAVVFEDKPFCRPCALALAPTLSASQKIALEGKLAGAPKQATSKILAPDKPVRDTLRKKLPLPPSRGGLKMGAVLGAAALVGILVLAAVLVSGGSKRDPSQGRPAAKVSEAPPPPPPPEPPKPDNKRAPLDRAREFAQTHPNELVNQILTYEKAIDELKDSPFAAEAKKELEALRAKKKINLEEEFKQVAAEVDGLARAQEFGKAIDLLYKARRRHDEFEWMDPVDKKMQEVAGAVEDLFGEIKGKALWAWKGGREKEVDEYLKSVQKWGIDRFVFDLKKALEEAKATPVVDASKKEFVFASATLKGGGLFALADNSKLGRLWAMREDHPSTQEISNNFVEAEFQGQADVSYKCYVYLGGCCRSSLDFYFQGPEMTAFSKDGKRRSIEAGNRYFLGLPLENAPADMPVKHADHAAVSEPIYWEWRVVTLPKSTTAGSKRVRVLGRIKGVSVACVYITTGDAPPKDLPSIKKLIEGR